MQVDSDAVRRDQQEAIERVTAAVTAAQEILAGGSLETGKRKAGLPAADRPSKRARVYGFEDFSESDSDGDSEFEAAAQLNQAGQIAATASSGNDSDASAQEVALSIARDGPVPSHSRNLGRDLTEQSAAAANPHSDALLADMPSGSGPKVLSHGGKPPLGRSLSRSQAVTDADEPAAAAATAAAVMTPEAYSASTDGKASLASPAAAEEPSSSKQTGKEPAVDDKEPVVDDSPIDLSDFATPAELESAGLVKLKHELARHGLKCSGSLSERAARLFLLKVTSVDKLDQKHFSKASKKT